jgi:hypothetical protein
LMKKMEAEPRVMPKKPAPPVKTQKAIEGN